VCRGCVRFAVWEKKESGVWFLFWRGGCGCVGFVVDADETDVWVVLRRHFIWAPAVFSLQNYSEIPLATGTKMTHCGCVRVVGWLRVRPGSRLRRQTRLQRNGPVRPSWSTFF
jgi:hypothetical protein